MTVPVQPQQPTVKDAENLQGVHPDLVMVVWAAFAYSPLPFMVHDGVRTVAEQKVNVSSGASKTMDSRHLHGLAVDILPLMPNGQPTTSDWAYFNALAVHLKGAAQLCGVPVEWGGDWQGFPDGAHWQLPKAAYPNPPPLGEEPIAV